MVYAANSAVDVAGDDLSLEMAILTGVSETATITKTSGYNDDQIYATTTAAGDTVCATITEIQNAGVSGDQLISIVESVSGSVNTSISEMRTANLSAEEVTRVVETIGKVYTRNISEAAKEGGATAALSAVSDTSDFVKSTVNSEMVREANGNETSQTLLARATEEKKEEKTTENDNDQTSETTTARTQTTTTGRNTTTQNTTNNTASTSTGTTTAPAAATATASASATPSADSSSTSSGGSSSTSNTVAVTGVSLNLSTMPLQVNGTDTLTATITPANADNQNVSWSSSNAAVASVAGNGLSATVTGVSAGTATITVTTADGAKTATCTVTVTAPTTATLKGNIYTGHNGTGINTSNTNTWYYETHIVCTDFRDIHHFRKGNLSEYNAAVTNGYTIHDVSSIGESVYLWLDRTTWSLLWYSTADIVYLPEDISGMFMGMLNIESIDLTGLDASNVKKASRMFEDAFVGSLEWSGFSPNDLQNTSYMFSGVSQLATIDLSNIDLSHVTDAYGMFYAGDNYTINYPTKIIVRPGTDLTGLSSSYGNRMFYNRIDLVGGNGTHIDSSHYNNDYARVDGVNGLPGLFSLQ